MSVYSTFRNLLTVSLALLITSAGYAATITWTGAGADDNWSTMANWDGPVGLDNDIIFDTAIGGDVNVDISPQVASIEFDNANVELYTLNIENTQVLTTESITNNAVGTNQTISGNGTLTSVADMTIDGAGDLTITAIITGNQNFIKNGTGTLSLNATNTLSGNITLAEGILSIANDNALGTGVLAASGGTIFGELTADEITNGDVRTIANDLSIAGDITIDNTADGAIVFTGDVSLEEGDRDINVAANGDATISGVISDGGSNPASLTKSGNGTATFSAANTYSGGTTLDAGTLKLGDDNALGTGTLNINGGVLYGQQASNQYRYISDTIAVVVGGDFGIDNDAGSRLSVLGTVDLGGATRTITIGTDGFVQFSNVIDNGGLIIDGGGTIVLTGDNTYADGITLLNGALAIADSSALGTGTFTVNNGELVTSTEDITITNDTIFDGDFTYTSDSVSDPKDLIFSGNVSLDGDSGLEVTRGLMQISSDITDGGGGFGITKSGEGTLQLDGSNTFTGSFTNNAGETQLSGGSSLSDDSELQVNDGTVSLEDSETVGSLSGAGGSVDIAAGKTLTLASDDDGTFEGALAGGGSLTKNGTGVLGLHGAGAMTGGVTINSGTLSVGNDTALGSGDLNLANGTTLKGYLTADEIADEERRSIANNVNIAGDITIDNVVDGSMDIAGEIDLGDATRTVTVAADGDTIWSGIITEDDGAGAGIIKEGDGRLIISGDNDDDDAFTGDVTLNAGTLGFGNPNAIKNNALIINGGKIHGEGEIELTSAGEITINDDFGISSTADGFLKLTDNINLTGSARTITLDADSTAEFAGVVHTGGLIIDGSGELILSGVNTYADGTTLNGSKLTITNADAIGDGELTFNGGDFGVQFETGDDEADITLDNTVNIDADFTYSSNATSASLIFSEAANLNADAIVTVDGAADTLTFDNAITDGGGNFKFTKDGDGRLILNATNTIGGGFDINNGIVEITDDGALGSGDVTLFDTAVLQASGRTLDNNIIIDNDATGTLAGTDSTTTLNGTITGLNADALFSIINSDTGGSPDLFKVMTAGADQFADDLNINIAANTELELGGADEIGSISGAGTFNAADQDLVLNSGTSNFTGELTGVKDIVVNGGDHTITSDITFGETVNDADALKVTAGSATLSGDLTVDGDVTVDAGAEATLTGDNAINGSVNVSGTLYASEGALNNNADPVAAIAPALANGATIGAATDTGWSTEVDIAALAADEGFTVDTTNGDTTIVDLIFTENLLLDQTGDNNFFLSELKSDNDGSDETLTINSGNLELIGDNIQLFDNDAITAAAGGRITVNGKVTSGVDRITAGAGVILYGQNAQGVTFNLNEQTGLSNTDTANTFNVNSDVNLLGDTVLTGNGTIDFQAGAGNALDLNGADRILTVEGDTTLIINSQITGADTLTISGTGTTSIATNQTTFTGVLAVDDGTLDLAATVDNDVTAAGGTLQLSVDDAVVAGNTLTIGDATVKVAGDDRTVAAATVLSGDATIVGDDTVDGEETITFSNTVDLAGGDRILTVDSTAIAQFDDDITNGNLNITGNGVTNVNANIDGELTISSNAANTIGDDDTDTIGGDVTISGNGANTLNSTISAGFDINVTGQGANTINSNIINGDLTIAGNGGNAYTGTITEGSIFITGHGDNTISGTVADGNILVSGDGQNEISGEISAGDLTVDQDLDDAITTLSGTVTGNVIVNGGNLRLNEAGTLTGTLTINGGGVQAQSDDDSGYTLANAVSINGDFEAGGTEQLIFSGATTLDNDATISISDEANFSIRNLTGGNDLTVSTAGGTLEIGDVDDLDTDLTGLTGDITITGENDGIVKLNAKIGDGTGIVTITGTAEDDRAILMGGGNFIGDITIGNHATHNPGNSIGTQTITDGDYTLANGATLEIEIDSVTGESDTIEVIDDDDSGDDGTATIEEGSTIYANVTGGGVLTQGQRFTIITAENGVTAPVDGANIVNDSAFYEFDGGFVGGDLTNFLLQVNITEDFESAATSSNGASVGRALNEMMFSDDAGKQALVTALQAMSAEEYNAALPQLDANNYIVAQQTTKRIANANNAYLTSRLEARRTGLDGLLAIQNNVTDDSPMLFASAAIDPMMFKLALDDQANRQIADRYRVSGGYPTVSPFEWQFYGRFYGGFDKQDTRDDYLGFDGDTIGFMVGMDKLVDRDTIFGVSFNYDKTDVTFEDNRGTAKVDTLRAGPYWSWEFDQSFFDLTTSFGYHSTDMNRVATVDGTTYTPTSSYNAWDLILHGGTGLVYKVEHWWMIPTVSLQYQYFNQGSTTEQGGGAANLNVDNWTNHSLQSHLAFRANRIFEVDDLTIVPELGVGWRHEFFTPSGIGSTFTGETTGMSFVANGDAKDSLTYSAALSALLNQNTTLFLRFDGEFHKDGSTNVVSAGFTFRK